MNTLKPIFILLIFFSITVCSGSVPDTIFTKRIGNKYDDEAFKVIKTKDNNFLLTGVQWRDGYTDIWLIKVDSNGDTLWTNIFNKNRYNDGYDLIENELGYLILGTSSPNIWLIQTDFAGDTLWTRTYGGKSNDYASSFDSVKEGGYILAGGTESFGNGGMDVWLIRINRNGDTLWTKTFGESQNEIAEFVRQTKDGGFIISAQTNSIGNGGSDRWIIRVDNNGNLLWSKTFGGKGDEGSGPIIETPIGDFLSLGTTNSFGNGGSDGWLIKLNSSGDSLWSRTYGGNQSERLTSMSDLGDDNYILSGITSSFGVGASDLWCLKINSIGDTLWTKTVGGPKNDGGWDVAKIDVSTYLIVGFTESFGAKDGDIWLVKLGDIKTNIQNKNLYLYYNFEINANYPNPFNSSTIIDFKLRQSSIIELSIFDINGKKIKELINEERPAGRYKVPFNGYGFASGLYFIYLKADGLDKVKKMLLIK